MLNPEILEPAYIQFKASGRGKFKFGCVACGIDATSPLTMPSSLSKATPKWMNFSGSGWAELDDDGSERRIQLPTRR